MQDEGRGWWIVDLLVLFGIVALLRWAWQFWVP